MRLRILIASALFAATAAHAADIKVIGSPGFREAYTLLLPDFEKMTGHSVTTVWGGVNDVAKRVAAGETADIVILPAKQIGDLIASGKLIRETRADVARSGVGIATRKGAPKIDISTSDGVKKALLAANRISYSMGPSGVHMADVIRGLGIEDQVKGKIVIAPSDTPVGEILARGQADIGFQQVSELIRIKTIDYLGPLPADIQETTVFSAAVHKNAASGEAARALVRYLSSPGAAPVIRKTGMDPG